RPRRPFERFALRLVPALAAMGVRRRPTLRLGVFFLRGDAAAANVLAASARPVSTSIAFDASGMPRLARSLGMPAGRLHDAKIAASSSARVAAVFAWSSSAASPATWGVAIDDPSIRA